VSKTNVFIPMADGVRLAATLYMPETTGPWPALVEAYPYRKDDVSVWADDYRRLRDEGDYVVCRVDTRGTGTSEGIATAEYPPGEADDLCAVIGWLAAQDWCTGAVGMFGTSYAGFATLHVGMRPPPQLKAIVPIYATDDRYTDDVHFAGGVRKAIEFGYPLFMVSMNALPPVPALAGDGWHELWLRRIDELEPWFGSIEEQTDGPFWRRGSVRPDYHLIGVPTMIIGGWSDLYRSSALRLFEGIRAPKRLLMGPWSHMEPIGSIPGPRIDHVHELIRWFDRWLRDAENGIDHEPPIVVFARRTTRPEPDLDAYDGEWRFEPDWPPERSRPLCLDQRPGSLGVGGGVGIAGHIRGSYPPPYGLPLDQRTEDAYSLVTDWPTGRALEILGIPAVELRVRSSHPVAYAAVRLCEVLADGTSILVSRGILNLTHRESHADPQPLVPEEPYRVTIELDATSWTFTPGSRIRLAIAGSDWPNAWPPPHASTLTVDAGALRLPELDGPSPVAERPSVVPVPGRRDPGGDGATWLIERDVYRRETRVTVHSAPGRDRVRAGVTPHNPGDAWVESTAEYEVRWPEVAARTIADLTLRSDPETYTFDLRLDVFENGRLLAQREWHRIVPRTLQ
jgi:predicted acyl esterase